MSSSRHEFINLFGPPASVGIQATVFVRNRTCVVSEQMGPGAEIAQLSSDRDADVLAMKGTPQQVEAFLSNVRATHLREIEILMRTETSVVVRGRNPEGVVTTILRAGCTILWPSLVRGSVHRQTILARDRARLDGLLRDLSRLGEAWVERIVEVGPDTLPVSIMLADMTGSLTARQLEVLRLAIARGYYERPRRASALELAREVGVGRSTFEEHLRKAEQGVLEWYARAVDANEILASGATKARGRPPARTRIEP